VDPDFEIYQLGVKGFLEVIPPNPKTVGTKMGAF